MAARLSTRISLRWVPDEPEELTNTLVMNVGGYFMDLRVNKADTSIDWAMAGERQILSKDPLKCRWIKVIDSLGPSDPDEGIFSPLPNGDDLETGSMPCAHKNDVVTDYEEVWRKLDPVPGPKRAWIIQSVEDSPNGGTFLGRVAGSFMALRQNEDLSFSVRSESLDENAQWNAIYAIGKVEGVPSFAGVGVSEFEGEEEWKEGNIVSVLDRKYVVRAFEDLSSEMA
ncbi:hypothetical protein V495_02993 [Pseudogymnoascus sp. VKM F-4514 (FW-929)]|nr:hypothetical protein V495_02993 [Pseudogymnoascus sp. VKM F-4514 (FW-929)]KFY56381.1 hypothetical protein V497_06305 [Pseudogymnoascus sp. VKM F-4516 (FW-969)]